MTGVMRDELAASNIVDRRTFHAELDGFRVREKAHTREGDAIAAVRRRLPISVRFCGVLCFGLVEDSTPMFHPDISITCEFRLP
jgi:Bacterial protein of unknown function (DUF899)